MVVALMKTDIMTKSHQHHNHDHIADEAICSAFGNIRLIVLQICKSQNEIDSTKNRKKSATLRISISQQYFYYLHEIR